MDFFNTTFYDNESEGYSRKRYNVTPTTYTHFFFQDRLSKVVSLVGEHFKDGQNLIMIEDGCADGVVLYSVDYLYPDLFSKIIGTDISPKMIEAAAKRNKKEYISFVIKDAMPEVIADCFLAIGFVSPGIFKEEFAFIDRHLASNGLCIMSLVSNNSLYAKFKLKDKKIAKDYRSFAEYEKILSERFEIVDSVPYGLFIPKLWAAPSLARFLQPLLEKILRPFPQLFHEKLYVLRPKP